MYSQSYYDTNVKRKEDICKKFFKYKSRFVKIIYVGITTNEIYVEDPIRGSVKTQEES